MRLQFAVFIGQITGIISKLLHLGSGSTWTGEIALRIEPDIIKILSKKLDKIILIAGTNGKTTTSKMIRTLLSDYPLVYNEEGANLVNGIASALVTNYAVLKEKNVIGVFEIDEATLPLILKELIPDVIVLLNLFRDQLDRYGEVRTLASKWKKSVNQLSNKTTLVLNADDAQIVFIGKEFAGKKVYFGCAESLDGKSTEQQSIDRWGDSLFCPDCGNQLFFQAISFSHLGDWRCSNCEFIRPPLDHVINHIHVSIEGVHNKYNATAALLAVSAIGIKPEEEQLHTFTPAFGRMEEIIVATGEEKKRVLILLSKNPTGFNQNIKLLTEKNGVGSILLVLNNRIPDGRDVSWIWDVDFGPVVDHSSII
ncbi:DUF1727 domain-containing protein, partial [Candidatus Roizmanbacteria bacterium]|nr:DUF1727 domain-containing protein [Candidatus Roizmanbacteria bacterium]